MTDREKLIKILNVPIYPRIGANPAEVVADYLMDNGVRPERHAHWEKYVDGFHRCSNCHYETGEDDIDWSELKFMPPKFCKNCGAKMDEAITDAE